MKHSIILIAALLAFAACSRDHDGKLDSSFETELADIVTYTGVDQDNHATFRLDQRDDLPPITLFTTVAAPSKVQLNDRVLLYYAISHKAPDGTYWTPAASRASTATPCASTATHSTPTRCDPSSPAACGAQASTSTCTDSSNTPARAAYYT